MNNAIVISAIIAGLAWLLRQPNTKAGRALITGQTTKPANGPTIIIQPDPSPAVVQSASNNAASPTASAAPSDRRRHFPHSFPDAAFSDMGLPTQQMQMRTATSPQATPAKGKGGCGGDCNKCKGNSPDTYTDGAGACMFPTTPALISWLQQNFPNMFNGGMVQQSISQGKLDTGGTIFGVIPPPNQPIISDLDDYNNLVGQTLDNTITAASGAVGTGIYAGNTGPTLDQIALQSASWLDTLYNAGVAAGAL